MKKHSKIKFMLIVFAALVSIVIVSYSIKNEILLANSPEITNFTDVDIKLLESEFLITFPNNTKFINSQYLWSFQDPSITVTFEIPKESVDNFLNTINQTFKKSLSNTSSLGSSNIESFYESKSRQFTGLYLYSEKNGFNKFYLYYHRPSDNIKKVFVK